MDDDALDLLLRQQGEHFRATHVAAPALPARRPTRRRAAVLLPLGAALAVSAVIGAVALVRPSDEPRVQRPLAGQRSSAVVLDVARVDAVALGGGWVAVAGGGEGRAATKHIELRKVDDLSRVVMTIPSVYKAGGPSCLTISGDYLLWSDVENIPSDYIPGPTGRWSLWERNLRTGMQARLASDAGVSSGMGLSLISCPVAGEGHAAWGRDGRIVVRDLIAGTSVSYPDAATPIAITASGIVERSQPSNGAVDPAADTMQVVLRSGVGYASRRVIASVPRGTNLTASGDRVLTFAADPAGDTSGGAIVSTCTLPDCATFTQLRRDPSTGIAVIGDGWAAWSDLTDTPALVRFDGGPVPAVAEGYVPFATLAASGPTFAYCTQPGGEGPITLHLLKVT